VFQPAELVEAVRSLNGGLWEKVRDEADATADVGWLVTAGLVERVAGGYIATELGWALSGQVRLWDGA